MSNSNTRKPAAAGTFYAAQDSLLRHQVETAFTHPLGPGLIPQVNTVGARLIVGIVCPHAGYAYSGPIAAHAYAALANDGSPDVAVLIGPNHRGAGSQVAIDSSQSWQTPLGTTLVDTRLAAEIQSNSRNAQLDSVAHLREHSLEVQLPFLQYLYGESIRIVPIIMASQDLAVSADIGRAIAAAVRDANAVVVASTDLTHYEPQQKAVQVDQHVLDAIIRVAPADLIRIVSKEHITMCGSGPVAAMLVAAQMLGAVRAHVLRYATSGDTSGDYTGVVGYTAAEVARGRRE